MINHVFCVIINICPLQYKCVLNNYCNLIVFDISVTVVKHFTALSNFWLTFTSQNMLTCGKDDYNRK